MKYSEIISKMTLEEKASLMSGKTCWETMDLKKYDLPSIFLSDGPNGLRKQSGASDQLGLNPSIPSTCFPTVAGMANSWNVALGELLGTTLGNEARSLGVNVVLGPGMNIKRNPLAGRNFEYFSEDPYLAGKMAASYVKGIQSNGVAACIKHFCCNNQELKREEMDSIVDERTLREIYLTGFEIAVKEGGAKSIMSAYNKINGDFANENKHILIDILRQEWGFKGAVITDWGGNNIRAEGIKCRNCLEMPSTAGETNREIVKAVKDGTLDEKALDACVDDLLDLVFSTYHKKEEGAANKFDAESHDKVAEQCAEEAMVLLKNDGNTLPLTKKEKVCIIGDFAFDPRYQGAGSSNVNPTSLNSALDYLKKHHYDITGEERGFKRTGKKSKGLINKAVKLLNKSEVALVFVGLDEFSEAEGIDRKSLNLPQNQIDLLKALHATNKKVVAVLNCGSALNMDFDQYCSALIYASLGGQAGAEATIKLAYGLTNFSGKLSETIPLRYSDVPSAPYFPGVEKTAEYREGLFIGYRYYVTKDVKVKYPFGFGLSYTTFKYDGLTISEKGVSFKLTNTGNVTGKEVAQLYVGKKDTLIPRPKYELKGFVKVELKPKEMVKVEIPFDDKTFRYFNVKTNKWEVEAGTYQIMVASSSEDIHLEGEIQKEGTTSVVPYDKSALPNYFNGDAQHISDKEFETMLGYPIPLTHLKFIKKKRIIVDSNTTMSDLVYAKGWTGRAFAHGVNFGVKFLRFFRNKGLANTLIMGVSNQTVKVLSRMTNGMMCWGELEGLIMMFNGHFHKGLHHMIKAKKANKKMLKELKKTEEAEKKSDTEKTKETNL